MFPIDAMHNLFTEGKVKKMIHITLPDGSRKPFDEYPTGLDVAKSISEGLARDCVAMEIDGRLVDLSRPIESDAAVRLITTRDDEALEIMRHSAAHVMAMAVLNLYSDAKLTIGPVVEDGFYYDIDMEPLSEEAFAGIEAEMKRIVKAKLPIERGRCPSPRPWSFTGMNPTRQR
jgi:threonyl-tRNA synthetase